MEFRNKDEVVDIEILLPVVICMSSVSVDAPLSSICSSLCWNVKTVITINLKNTALLRVI